MLYVVDRIEENIAVLVSDNGDRVEADLSELHEGVRDGDIVKKSDTGYVFEKELTEKRKNSIKSRFDRLKKKMS